VLIFSVEGLLFAHKRSVFQNLIAFVSAQQQQQQQQQQPQPTTNNQQPTTNNQQPTTNHLINLFFAHIFKLIEPRIYRSIRQVCRRKKKPPFTEKNKHNLKKKKTYKDFLD